MVTLADIYRDEGRAGLRRLATAADTDHEYLYQIATGFRGGRKSPRRPSTDLAIRLMAADSRLSWESFYAPSQDRAA